MKQFKKLFTLTLGLFLLVALFSCNKAKETNILERGYFIVGFDQTFAPMGFRDTNGEYVGFDLDLAKAVAADLGVEVRFQPIDWAMKEAELNKGNIDVIWNGYTITEERAQLVTFSKPYLENRQVIVVMANSTINNKADLAGKKVGVQLASSSAKAVEEDTTLLSSLNGERLFTYKTNDLALIDLEGNGIDAVVVDEILARYILAKKGLENYRILEEDFGNEFYGVGMRKTDLEFIEKFNASFDKIIQNGKAGEISVTWFGEDIIKK